MCSCTVVRVGDAGSDLARLRRSILTKNMTLIDAAASNLPHISLEDALRILLVMAERRDPRYGRAAARWAARLTAEHRLELDQSRQVLALVEALPQAPDAIALVLRDLCKKGRA